MFNRLDADYRRLWDPSLNPLRPRYPDRLKAFMYACGKVAAIIDGKVKDVRPQVAEQPKARRPREARLLGPDGQPIGGDR